MPVPEHVVIPMSMHIGAPAEPVVKKGDTVMVGTVIGKAGGFVSANIYSSVSGTVQDIAPLRMVNGAMTTAVAIKTDGAQTVDPACVPPVVTDKASLLAAVQACGLVGVGGAGFPTHVKLAANTIDTLLINAAECEPYLTTDCREMLECSDTIISGITAVMKYCEIPHCIIGIERNKPECIDLLTSLTREMKGVEVKGLPMRYPQGAEKTLVETCTGREVPQVGPSGKPGLPADVGCVIMNVTSVSSLGKFLKTGIPLVTKRVTVEGDAIARPQNIEVPIGTLYRDVIDACGGVKEGVELGKIIFGGPMMGGAAPSADFPVLKQNNGLLLFPQRMQEGRRAARAVRLHPLRALHRGLPDGSGARRHCAGFCQQGLCCAESTLRGSLRSLRQLHLCLPGQAPRQPDDGPCQGLVHGRAAERRQITHGRSSDRYRLAAYPRYIYHPRADGQCCHCAAARRAGRGSDLRRAGAGAGRCDHPGLCGV